MHLRSGTLLLLVCLLAASCTPQAQATPVQAKTLTVLAAASLTESFNELGARFEAQNPGVKVAFNFAGSQQLAQQLAQGAPADVFASASPKYMDAAAQTRRVDPSSSKIFAKNRLVLIYPSDNPGGLGRLQDLAKAGLKPIVLGPKEGLALLNGTQVSTALALQDNGFDGISGRPLSELTVFPDDVVLNSSYGSGVFMALDKSGIWRLRPQQER